MFRDGNELGPCDDDKAICSAAFSYSWHGIVVYNVREGQGFTFGEKYVDVTGKATWNASDKDFPIEHGKTRPVEMIVLEQQLFSSLTSTSRFLFSFDPI